MNVVLGEQVRYFDGTDSYPAFVAKIWGTQEHALSLAVIGRDGGMHAVWNIPYDNDLVPIVGSWKFP